LAQAERRRFTVEYKRRILQEADACTKPGELGALLRREGLYSSHLATWRAARARGELRGLSAKKRGPKAKPVPAEAKRILALERENRRLRARAERQALVGARSACPLEPRPAPRHRHEGCRADPARELQRQLADEPEPEDHNAFAREDARPPHTLQRDDAQLDEARLLVLDAVGDGDEESGIDHGVARVRRRACQG
jgi:transposase-like protein